MKKITLLIAILMSAAGFSQVLSNGGFETGDDTNWGGYSYSVVASHGSMSPHSGSYFATRGLWSAALTNNFTVVPGTTYSVTFWYAHDSESYSPGSFRVGDWTGGSKVGFLDLTPVIADNGANASKAINYGSSFPTINTWKEGSFTFTASAGMTEARFQWWSENGAMAYLDDVDVTVSASIEKLKQFNFSYSPNPANDILNLNSAEGVESVAVYNLIGAQVLGVNNPGNAIDVSSLAKGIYVMKVTIEGKTGTFKFVKS